MRLCQVALGRCLHRSGPDHAPAAPLLLGCYWRSLTPGSPMVNQACCLYSERNHRTDWACGAAPWIIVERVQALTLRSIFAASNGRVDHSCSVIKVASPAAITIRAAIMALASAPSRSALGAATKRNAAAAMVHVPVRASMSVRAFSGAMSAAG